MLMAKICQTVRYLTYNQKLTIIINAVGLFGGIFGELLLLLSSIENMAKEEQYIHFKSINLSAENVKYTTIIFLELK